MRSLSTSRLFRINSASKQPGYLEDGARLLLTGQNLTADRTSMRESQTTRLESIWIRRRLIDKLDYLWRAIW
jgi:hypothetical protein